MIANAAGFVADAGGGDPAFCCTAAGLTLTPVDELAVELDCCAMATATLTKNAPTARTHLLMPFFIGSSSFMLFVPGASGFRKTVRANLLRA